MQQPIPLSLIRDLKCRHCAKFITCGPIHVVPDGSILCGRCRLIAKQKYRNFAYEALASIFYYPCSNWIKHCPYQLNWNESLEHEPDCIYQSWCKLFWNKPRILCRADNELPEHENINLSHITEQIIDQLKCIYCESYLSCDPVYIGIDGKNVCHRCTTSNGLPQGCIRNLSYEKLASIIIFPCIYRFRGCTIRLRYGRDMWKHELECSYGQIYRKPPGKKLSKNGKERGVIETHSGHYYGTITPNSALFSPPKPNKVVDGLLTQELVHAIKKKHSTDYFNRQLSFESQSGVEGSVSGGESSPERHSRQSNDTITMVDDNNYSIKPFGGYSSGPLEHIPRPSLRDSDNSGSKFRYSLSYQPRLSYSNNNNNNNNLDYRNGHLNSFTGFNSNYFSNNIITHSPSFNYPPRNYEQNIVQRSESLRVGNKEIINELKARQSKQKIQEDDSIPEGSAGNKANQGDDNPYMQCNSLQDIVHVHDEVFDN